MKTDPRILHVNLQHERDTLAEDGARQRFHAEMDKLNIQTLKLKARMVIIICLCTLAVGALAASLRGLTVPEIWTAITGGAL